MNIVIAGAGKVGSTIAQRLCSAGHDITLIDENQLRLDSAANAMDVMTCCGSCAPAMSRASSAARIPRP